MPEPDPLPYEAMRLSHLERSGLGNLTRLPALDPIVRTTAELLATEIAAVSILRGQDQILVSSVGLPFQSATRDSGICVHAMAQPSNALLIPDARYDPRTMDSPLVVGPPFIRGYAGRPLCLISSMAVGTLCACALSPRSFSPDQIAALDRLADAATAILHGVARDGRQSR